MTAVDNKRRREREKESEDWNTRNVLKGYDERGENTMRAKGRGREEE